jgi:hypothetical protein
VRTLKSCHLRFCSQGGLINREISSFAIYGELALTSMSAIPVICGLEQKILCAFVHLFSAMFLEPLLSADTGNAGNLGSRS